MNEICRCCMNMCTTTEMQSLNGRLEGDDRNLWEILSFVTDVTICKESILPKQICTECLNGIRVAYLFKNKCKKAEERLNISRNHLIEVANVKDENNLSCGYCGRQLNDVTEVMYHMGCHENPYQCSLCLLRYPDWNALEVHLSLVHNHKKCVTTKLECSNCERAYDTPDSYKSHLSACLKPDTAAVVNDNHENGSESYFSDEDVPIAEFYRVNGTVAEESKPKIENEVLFNRKKYNCIKCLLHFDSKKDFKAHMKTFHPVNCKLLSPKKHKKKSTKTEPEELNNRSPPELTICERENKTDLNLDVNIEKNTFVNVTIYRHQPDYSGEDVKIETESYPCSMCERKFVKKSSLDAHKRRHEARLGEIHVCTICKREFKHRAHLDNHVLSLHSSKKGVKCDLCNKNFSQQDSLNLHMLSHSDQKRHQCEMCEKAFNMLSTLRDHMRTHTGEKPFLCSTCGRGFSQKTNLKEHMRRHLGQKPFNCDMCDQRFVSKGELTAHQRKHSGAHPFVCDACGAKFTTSSSLVKHRRTHTGERPYLCDICPMKFAALSTLKNHKRTHTGEKPYICKYCDKGFGQKTDMTMHMRGHTGERPYSCDACGQTFRQGSTLKTHLKTHLKKSLVYFKNNSAPLSGPGPGSLL